MTNTRSNKFPGRCKCGLEVPAYAGLLAKKSGKWVVSCASCTGTVAPTPTREMLGTLFWPNGEGETECTLEYEALSDRVRDLQQQVDENPEDHVAYNDYCQASNDLAVLQMNGHLGEPVRYAKPDVMTALLGGGRVTASGQIVTERRP